MGIRETGGMYGEAGGSTEVTYECYNTGEIIVIENRGERAPFCWNVGMGLGEKGEVPEIGTSGFLPTTEDDRIILGKTVTGVFSKRTRQ